MKLTQKADQQQITELLSAPITLQEQDLSIQNWQGYARMLQTDEGCSAGAPRGAAIIDAQIAEATICPRCKQGMTYAPYHREGAEARYFAFAVCLRDNVAIEF